jgi:hypothetical protein
MGFCKPSQGGQVRRNAWRRGNFDHCLMIDGKALGRIRRAEGIASGGEAEVARTALETRGNEPSIVPSYIRQSFAGRPQGSPENSGSDTTKPPFLITLPTQGRRVTWPQTTTARPRSQHGRAVVHFGRATELPSPMLLVPMVGFEPTRLSSPPPQDGVSTNFTTSA